LRMLTGESDKIIRFVCLYLYFKKLIYINQRVIFGVDMSTEPKLITQEARYLMNMNYLILPLDFRDFRQALAKNGFELALVRNLPPPPTRISFSGEIARKKDTVIIADSEASEIGVISRSLGEASASFGDLLKIVTEEIGVDLSEKAKSYKIIVHYKLNTGKIPLKEIPKAENKEFVNKFSEIMGEGLSSFSIRLAKKDSSINKGDWLDIAIEPDLIYENYYHIGVVYRNSNKEKTEAFAKDLETNLMKLINHIEA
jgi:hypothetical protein